MLPIIIKLTSDSVLLTSFQLNILSKPFSFSQDLVKKFNETTQYKNMKQMLTSKNEQIKELRSRLRK